jgi:hypothetical protein
LCHCHTNINKSASHWHCANAAQNKQTILLKTF